MKNKKNVLLISVVIISMLLLIIIIFFFKSVFKKENKNKVEIIETGKSISGNDLIIRFYTGTNYYTEKNRIFFKAVLIPQMAVWIEDLEGNYIDTIFITNRSGKSNWRKFSLKKGEVRRKAALPYWAHKRGLISDDGIFMPSKKTAVSDSVTSATPIFDFIIKNKFNNDLTEFVILAEINKSWDYNDYYTKKLLEGSEKKDHMESSYSGQPSIIYSAKINTNEKSEYIMKQKGHSDPSGDSGELFLDMTKIDSALKIINKIEINFKKE